MIDLHGSRVLKLFNLSYNNQSSCKTMGNDKVNNNLKSQCVHIIMAVLMPHAT